MVRPRRPRRAADSRSLCTIPTVTRPSSRASEGNCACRWSTSRVYVGCVRAREVERADERVARCRHGGLREGCGPFRFYTVFSRPGRDPVSGGSAPRWARPRTEGLSPPKAARVYDRIGRLQDTQRVFEAPALARLTADGRLSEARCVVEVGCGTGRFASGLLTNVCCPQCRYVGLDVSPRMCRIATARLSRWSARARVMCVDGTVPLPLPAACADRVLAAFVVDLLPPDYARQLLADTHRGPRAWGFVVPGEPCGGHHEGQSRLLLGLEHPRPTCPSPGGRVSPRSARGTAGCRVLGGPHRHHRDRTGFSRWCPGGRTSGVRGRGGQPTGGVRGNRDSRTCFQDLRHPRRPATACRNRRFGHDPALR